MRLLMKWMILGICFSSILNADWNPEAYFGENPNGLMMLQNREFNKLKKDVKQTLKGSWCSAEKIDLLMDLVVLTRPSVCVEIGAFTGSSVLPVAATLKYLNFGKIYAIDAWSNVEAVKYLASDDPNKPWWSQVYMNGAHKDFKRLIDKWSFNNLCVPIRLSSERAIDRIPTGIDFLHLDGDYSEVGSLQDVQLYLPKVKSGGYILLSNLYIIVNREQPKIQAFCALCDDCEVVTSIERDNAVLFKKL